MEFVPGTEIEKPAVHISDGNAFGIVGEISKALKRVGVEKDIVDEYRRKSMQGDYDHLLSVAMDYADIEVD